MSVTVTFAPATALPCGSVTVPIMLPYTACPDAVLAPNPTARQRTRIHPTVASLLITPLLTAFSCLKAIANSNPITSPTSADALRSSVCPVNSASLRQPRFLRRDAFRYENGNAAAEPTDQLAVNSPQTPRPESRYAKPNRYPSSTL